jgi:hypothetical protein
VATLLQFIHHWCLELLEMFSFSRIMELWNGETKDELHKEEIWGRQKPYFVRVFPAL